MDPYASRVVEECQTIARPDPIVWGSTKAGPLSSEQVSRYREQGYLVCEQLLSPDELALLLSATAELQRSANAERDDVIAEPGSHAVRSVFRVHRSEPFAKLAADSRLAGSAMQILGSHVYIHQSRINFKPGFDGRPFPWHSDFETWHIEDGMPRPRALSASVLLTDNESHNGPLLVIPGSHRSYVTCFGQTPANHFASSLVNQQYGVPSRDVLARLFEKHGIQAAEGRAGTVVFFDANLMHGSGGNITPLPRNNVFLVYNSVDNALVTPFGAQPPRPGFLAEREVDRIAATQTV